MSTFPYPGTFLPGSFLSPAGCESSVWAGQRTTYRTLRRVQTCSQSRNRRAAPRATSTAPGPPQTRLNAPQIRFPGPTVTRFARHRGRSPKESRSCTPDRRASPPRPERTHLHFSKLQWVLWTTKIVKIHSKLPAVKAVQDTSTTGFRILCWLHKIIKIKFNLYQSTRGEGAWN